MSRWRLPLITLAAAIVSGIILGAIFNLIDGRISRDYFAIVMDWDWIDAPTRAIGQGIFEGCILGIVFAIVLTFIAAASTHMRCPPRLIIRAIILGDLIVAICWIIGGLTAFALAHFSPALWGFTWTGVPSRVDLPRFAWVGGSIWGAYAGVLLALIIAGVDLHRVWRRLNAPSRGFAIRLKESTSTTEPAELKTAQVHTPP